MSIFKGITLSMANKDIASEKRSDYVAYAFLLITVTIWGSTWPLGKWLVTDTAGATIPPLMIVLTRYTLVVCGFFILLRWREGSFHIPFVKKHFFLLVFMGILNVTIYQAGYMYGEYYTAASDASLVVSSGPIWVLLISVLVMKERADRRKIFGTILGFIGILFVVGFSPNTNEPNRLLGDALILMSAISYASYTVSLHYLNGQYAKNDVTKPSSLNVLTWISFFGFLTTLPMAFFASPEYLFTPALFLQIPPRIWFGISYLAVLSTLVGYVMYAEGVFRLTATRAAIFSNFIPIVGIALSAVFLQEKIDPVAHIIALIIILIGVTLVNSNVHKKDYLKQTNEQKVSEDILDTRPLDNLSNIVSK